MVGQSPQWGRMLSYNPKRPSRASAPFLGEEGQGHICPLLKS